LSLILFQKEEIRTNYSIE